MGPWLLDFGWAGDLLGALLIAWMINLYNFMDGIDGIAGLESITVTGGAGLLLVLAGATSVGGWLLLLGACGAGFLPWNWPPAKIFMGDAGSGFLGYILAVFAIWSGNETGISFWSWLILWGVFLVDATWTLIRRIVQGECFYRVHCSHAYQKASNWFDSHLPVTICVGLINVFWLFPLAGLATWHNSWGFF